MFLSSAEEKTLKGEDGIAAQWAMKFLAEYGEALEADRLIDISSVAIGWSDPFRGLMPPEVFSDLLTHGFKVPAYGLEIGLDREFWTKLGISKEEVEKQKFMDEKAKDVGLFQTWTCIPYTAGYLPMKGSHCSVVENSLIAFVNSVFGARTLRESSQSVLASSIVGKSPNAGLHLDENRRANLLFRVNTNVTTPIEFDSLGYYAGELSEVDVPAFAGIKQAGLEEMKYICASSTCAGGIGLFHVIGITPEAPNLEAAFGGQKPKETIDVTGKELEDTIQKLSTGGPEKVDLVVLGCPHYTIKEVQGVERFLRGKKINNNTKLWVFAPCSTRDIVGKTNLITAAGGVLFADTCTFLLHTFGKSTLPADVQVVATDSAKMAHYLANLYPVDVWYGSTTSCLNAALTGVWKS
jgi:hypothetical protein